MNQYKKEALEYIKDIRDDLWQIKSHSDGEDHINFKLDTLTDIINDI